MSLFSLKTENAFKREATGNEMDCLTLDAQDGGTFTLGGKRENVELVIGEIEKNEIKQFVTRAQWSNHELLEYILSFTGPAEVYLTTWSISENPVRVIVGLLEKKLITELHCVFDYRIRTQNANAFQLAENNFVHIKLVKCHAKIMVVVNEEWSVTVIGSANFNNNPRIESGVIFTDRKSAVFNRDWILGVMQEGEEIK